jgi:hypothetical protein
VSSEGKKFHAARKGGLREKERKKEKRKKLRLQTRIK